MFIVWYQYEFVSLTRRIARQSESVCAYTGRYNTEKYTDTQASLQFISKPSFRLVVGIALNFTPKFALHLDHSVKFSTRKHTLCPELSPY